MESWRSISERLRRAIVTKMSDTPRRSTSTCSWATLTSVSCIELNASASSASSSLPLVLTGAMVGSAELPRGSRSASTRAGSCSVATWLALVATAFIRRVIERVMNQAMRAPIRIAVSVIAIRISVSLLVASARALASATIDSVIVASKSTPCWITALNPATSNWRTSDRWAARMTLSSCVR